MKIPVRLVKMLKLRFRNTAVHFEVHKFTHWGLSTKPLKSNSKESLTVTSIYS
jgi:hypothetical protein